MYFDKKYAILYKGMLYMPGSFFIYKAAEPEELIYANRATIDIFGCDDLEDFKRHTGFTFKGMLHHDDYKRISKSIIEQIDSGDENFDYAEYRIIRKDGSVRWVDDYGHYTETESYGGIYYVFVSDITEKKKRMESDLAVRQAGAAYYRTRLGFLERILCRA